MESHTPTAARCPTLTVDDAPAAKDLFGSHEPIAAAVHELIKGEAGGRTIGLEGSWGSGKSTIVALLADRMREPSSHIVVFDAWSHEGDPLRRSFLEELISSLGAKGWIDREEWHKRREELARCRRVEKTRPVPKVEMPAIVAGVAAMLLAILVPAGAALLEAGLGEGSRSVWVTGAAVHSALLVGAFAALVVLLVRRHSRPEGDPWLSLFSVRSVTESDRETIETPDPTSIEFESTFKDLMHEALGADPARRLVLVVDNLDRVAPEDARTVWATLQTFLHHPDQPRAPWLDSLWVVLPYDRDGISRLWDGSTQGLPEIALGRGSLAESFIEKSVQLQFEVPKPLLSSWREYLESTLKAALPQHGADSYVAYRLYAHRLATAGRAPSPRELKRYVNRIGALHRRWQHALPFPSLAYYASLGVSGSNVAECLRRDRLPEASVAGLLGDNVQGNLAAIAFNTHPDRARQLLLGPLIERALMGNDAGELVALLDRPGFWDALLQSSLVEAGPGTTPSLLTAAIRLGEIPEQARPDAEWREVTSLLAQGARSAETWPSLSRRFSSDLSGLLALVDRSSAREIAGRATDTEIQAGQGSDWSEGASALLSEFEWLTVQAAGPAEVVLEALAEFTGIEGWEVLADRLKVRQDALTTLSDAIATRVTEAPTEALGALKALGRVDPSISLDTFVATAGRRLREYAPSQDRRPQLNAGETQSLLGILRMAEQGSQREHSAPLSQEIALEYVKAVSDQGDKAALGDWLYEVLRLWSASGAARVHTSFSQSGKALVDQLLRDPSHERVSALTQAMEGLGDFDLVASIGGRAEGEALAAALVEALQGSERFIAAMSGARFHGLWPHIARAGESGRLNLHKFVGAVCASPTFGSELESEAFSEDRMDMYAAVLATHPDQTEVTRLAGWVARSLTGLTRNQWQRAMSDSENSVRLLSTLHRADNEVRIGGAFAQALTGLLDRVADGEAISNSVVELWEDSVLPLLAPTVRGAYAQGAAATAVRVQGGLPSVFFDLAGLTLRGPDIIARPDVLQRLLPHLVLEENAAGLRWLVDTLEDEEVCKVVPEGGFGALSEVVGISLRQDVEISEVLVQVAQLIGVDVAAGDANGPEQ